jgi:GTPase SAR1 family protein
MSGSESSDTVSGSDIESANAIDAEQNLPIAPSDIKFRVLIIGRANAGKTSILQRVCDTTESPEIYSVDSEGVRTRVRSRSL